ncbi:MAG: hypothetical protein H6512_01010 [Acidimicrobiia bacterium]|nr:hypothetical protein [Acidimicrobiia bacterium]
MLRSRPWIRPIALIGVLALVLGVVALMQRDALASEVTLAKETITPMPVGPGDPIKFQLTYECIAIEDNCDNATIVDQLPPEFSWDPADVTWAYNTGVGAHIDSASFDSGTGQITFVFKNAPDFEGGSSGTIEVFATFKVGVLDGTTVQNTATFAADGATTVSDSSGATVSADNTPEFSGWKSAETLSAGLGEEAIWTFGGTNTGGAVIDEWTWDDTIDTANLEFTQIDIGTTGNAPGATMQATLQYATVQNPTLQTAGTFTLTDTQQTVTVGDLGLAAGDLVSRVVLTYTNIPIGFQQSSSAGTRPMLHGTVTNVPANGEITNCLVLEGTDQGVMFQSSGTQCGTVYNAPVLSPTCTRRRAKTSPKRVTS